MSGSLVLAGEVDPVIVEEFPGVSICSLRVEIAAARTSRGLEHELGLAAARINGAVAVREAAGTVPAAYRAFARRLGMDPGVIEGTADAAIRRRLMEGGFKPAGMLADACTLATLETGVPLAVLADAAGGAAVDLRVATQDDLFHRAGDLVLTSGDAVLSRLFGEAVPGARVSRMAGSATVVAVGAPGIEPGMAVMALERVSDLLRAA